MELKDLLLVHKIIVWDKNAIVQGLQLFNVAGYAHIDCGKSNNDSDPI